MQKLSKPIQVIISFISIIAIIYMIVIYVWASSYTVLIGDEISDGVGIGAYRLFFPFHIGRSLLFMLGMYISWQGTYSAMFLQALMNPINGYMLPQLRIVMIINTLLLMISILILIYELFQHLLIKKIYLILVTYFLVLFAFFGFAVYGEVFFWYSGSTPFGYPFTFMLIGLSLFLRYYRMPQKKYANWAKFFGFLACGGTLMITGASCYFALLIVMFYSLKERKIDKNGIKIFLWWLAGALLNALAPGNFVRKGSGQMNLLGSIYSSAIITLRNIKGLIKGSFLFEIVVIFIIFGIIIGLSNKKSDHNKRTDLLLCVTAFLTPISSFVSCFPAVLGYGATADWNLNNRCNFVINTCFIMSVIFIGFVIGYMLSSIPKSKYCIPFLLLATIFYMFLFPYDITENKFFELNKQLSRGEFQEYYAICDDYYDKLDSYPDGSDVRIPISDVPEPISNTVSIYYFEDPTNPDNWLNTALAKLFKLNSFALDDTQ